MNKENQKIKYFLYARRSVKQSDREETVVSIDSQIKEMKAVAERESLKIVDVLHEIQ